MYEGEDAGNVDVRTTDCVAAGAGRLCADLVTEVEVIIMGAHSITMFPLLNTDLTTHVEAMLLLAEVRAACSGDAVVITEAIVGEATRAVHLGCADPHIFISHACNECLSTKCEGEDTGTAGVRSRHGVAAGAGRLCTDPAT